MMTAVIPSKPNKETEMKKITAIAAAALLGITGAAVAADSAANMQQPKQTREFKRGELPRDLQALNLSAAQKTRIQAIMQEGRPAQTELSEAQRNQMRAQAQAHRAAEQSLMANKTFDEAVARRLIAEREQARAQFQQRHADFEMQQLKKRHAIFQVLTPAQQKQWQESQNKRAERSDRPGKPRQMPQQDRQAPQR